MNKLFGCIALVVFLLLLHSPVYGMLAKFFRTTGTDDTTANPETRTTRKTKYTFQLVSEEGEFIPTNQGKVFQDLIIKNLPSGSSSSTNQYYFVSIFGSQTTGKSFLLNAIFDLDFPVKSETTHQLTQGVWLGLSRKPSKVPILVLDTEGADSYERYSANHWDIEGQVGLLAMSFSNVIIINMYTSEVGRNSASNLPLLDRIITVYLKMTVTQKAFKRPVLLFVLRDYSLKSHGSLIELKRYLEDSLNTVLQSHKSKRGAKSVADISIQSLFQMEIVALPLFLPDSLEYYEKFTQQVNDLSDRFHNLSREDFLFRNMGGKSSLSVPVGTLLNFLESVWQEINNYNNLLNLPAQQSLHAKSICEAIVVELKEKLRGFAMGFDVTAIQTPTELKKKLNQEYTYLTEEYDRLTVGLDETVVLSEREAFSGLLLGVGGLQGVFRRYLRKMRQELIGNFEDEARRQIELKKEFIIDSMKQIYLKEKDRFQGMLEEAALVESWKTEGQLLSKLDGQLRVILLRIEEAAVDLNKKSSMKIFRTKVQGLLEEMETELLCGMIPIRLKSPESLTEFAMKKLISIRNEVTSGMKADLRHYFTEKSGVLYSKLLLAYFTEAKIIAIGLERFNKSFMNGKTDPLAVFHNSDSLLDAKTKAWNDTSIALKNIQILLGGSSDEINAFMKNCQDKLVPRLNEVVSINCQRLEDKSHTRFPYILLLLVITWVFGYFPIILPGFFQWHVVIPFIICLSQFLIACLPHYLRQYKLIKLFSWPLLVDSFIPIAKYTKNLVYSSPEDSHNVLF